MMDLLVKENSIKQAIEADVKPKPKQKAVGYTLNRIECDASNGLLATIGRYLLSALFDMLAVIASGALALSISYLIRSDFYGPDFGFTQSLFESTPGLSMLLLPFFAIPLYFTFTGQYGKPKPRWSDFYEILKVVLVCLFISVIVMFLLKERTSRLWAVLFWVGMLSLLPISREICRKLQIRLGIWFKPVLIVGSLNNALKARKVIELDKVFGAKVIGIISERVGSDELGGGVCNGATSTIKEDIRKLVEARGKLEVLYTGDECLSMRKVYELMKDLNLENQNLSIAMSSSDLPVYRSSIVSFFSNSTVLLQFRGGLKSYAAKVFKRLFDVVFSVLLMLLLSPLLITISFCLQCSGGQVVYRSGRVGVNGQIFDCYKFRSMSVNSEELLQRHLANNSEAAAEWESGFKLQNDPRITKIGVLLRRTSLDELPQLFNVVKGDMSLVGPRPILPEEQVIYGQSLEEYLTIRPGMTGLWQVCGRNRLSHEERVELNDWYIRNWTFWNDLVILIKTVPAAIY